jgi:putative transposase
MMKAGLGCLSILADLIHFLCLGLRSRTSLAAENLFLRKQLALYQEHKVKTRRADNPTCLTMVLLSRWFNWREVLIVVKPGTLIAWYRKGFSLFWHHNPQPAGGQSLSSCGV